MARLLYFYYDYWGGSYPVAVEIERKCQLFTTLYEEEFRIIIKKLGKTADDSDIWFM